MKDLISSLLVVEVCVGCSLSCALTLHNVPVNNTIRMISCFINLLKFTLCTKIIRIVQNPQSERINRSQGSRLSEIINLSYNIHKQHIISIIWWFERGLRFCKIVSKAGLYLYKRLWFLSLRFWGFYCAFCGWEKRRNLCTKRVHAMFTSGHSKHCNCYIINIIQCIWWCGIRERTAR